MYAATSTISTCIPLHAYASFQATVVAVAPVIQLELLGQEIKKEGFYDFWTS